MAEPTSTSGGLLGNPPLNEDEQRKAVELIQRTYRGHRTRRELNGFGLDPTTRWMETVRDAKWQRTTAPRGPEISSPARDKWHTVTEVARRAGADESDISTSEASDSEPGADSSRSKEEKAERARRKAIATAKRKQTAKMMDLQYFLEMVDQKHRYGSSLRKYHAHWKTQDTSQNFFYWLDQGEGKDFELEACSRSRLETEQVRYLTREERLKYLVRIDSAGQLIWAKNGERVWTRDELYRDSVNGIVPINDPSPEWKHNVKTEYHSTGSDSEGESSDAEDAGSTKNNALEGETHTNKGLHPVGGLAKTKHTGAGALFNQITRNKLKKGRKWIFVADTSMRLYVGYKQSGSFQHSTFLHGGRILSAGLIRIKDGQLHRLSPLSGHYQPPIANFRAFVHSLEDEGCDMSRVSISRSYAIIVGLESYVKTKSKIKDAEATVEHQIEKVVRPEKVKADEEAAQDHSKSAQREREFLEAKRQDDLQQNHSGKDQSRFAKNLSRTWTRLTSRSASDGSQNANK